MSLITEEIRAKAEIHHGNDICLERSRFLLEQVGLPSSLLPLKELEECGYVAETGFVWLKQRKKAVHKFEKIGKVVSYEAEVTAYVEPNRMKRLTGVKSKEILIWVSVADFSFDPVTRKISFKTPTGLFRSFPASAFEEEVNKKTEAGPAEAKDKDKPETVEAKQAEEVKEV